MMEPQNTERIYLIGMMGAGKSTVARKLAEKLRWVWADTDACVERRSGMPVHEIFAKYGEEEFRKREIECLRQSMRSGNVIIACGGGAPCYSKAMDMMLSSGHVIYLEAQIDTLVSRLSADPGKRPILGNEDKPLKDQLKMLMDQREPVYRRAHAVVTTDTLSELDVVDHILKGYPLSPQEW